MITVAPWKLTSQKVNPGVDTDADGQLETDLTGTWGCELDDLHTFQSNGVYEIDAGATKCDPNSPQIYYTSIWSFINNETKLIKPWGPQMPADTLEVVSISNSTLVLRDEDKRDNITYIHTYTFSH